MPVYAAQRRSSRAGWMGISHGREKAGEREFITVLLTAGVKLRPNGASGQALEVRSVRKPASKWLWNEKRSVLPLRDCDWEPVAQTGACLLGLTLRFSPNVTMY
ncbi:hypothetical protein SRHO_G00033160 [Serrasalmus rhombeus]